MEELPNHLYRCDRFERIYGTIEVKGGDGAINGGFACVEQYGEKTELSNNNFVYDLAGRSVSPWVSPLRIPGHFYTDSGLLVIGPKKEG